MAHAADQSQRSTRPHEPASELQVPEISRSGVLSSLRLNVQRRFHISPTLASLLIGLVVTTGAITAASVFQGAKQLAKERITHRLSDIAVLVASDINTDEVDTIRSKDQQNSPGFQRIHAELHNLPELASRKKLRGIRYVYILRRVEGKPKDKFSRYSMVVDGSLPNAPGFVETGEVMRTSSSTDALDRVWNARTFVVDRTVVTDQWGEWISGHYPLKRKDGSFEAVLGIDMNASSVDREALRILGHLIKGFALSMVVILPCVAIFGRRLSRPLKQIHRRHEALSRLEFGDDQAKEQSIDAQWIQEIYAISHSLKRMEKALQAFSRYVPIDLVRKLVLEEGSLCLDGENRELAIMFSDIIGFTSLSEHLPAKLTLSLLNEYFTVFQEAAKETRGTLDKYIGDAALVFWGAPESIPNPAHQCVEAALLCQQRLGELNRRWQSNNIPVTFETCFGLDFGEVVVGNVGSKDRINYTVVGDRVNLCSRLEHQNRLYGTHILASRSLIESLGEKKDNYVTVMVDICQLRGFQTPVEIHEIRGRVAEATAEELKFAEYFNRAWLYTLNSDPQEALSLLDQIPQDYKTLAYVRQLHDRLNMASQVLPTPKA